MKMLKTAVMVLAVAISIEQAVGQDDKGARCGPYHGWIGCQPSELPECCSQYGICSDYFRRAVACAQEKLGVFFDGDNTTHCIRDSDCQRSGQTGEYFCSEEPETMGYCGIRHVSVPFTGTISLTSAPVAKKQTPTSTTADPNTTISKSGNTANDTTSTSAATPSPQESTSGVHSPAIAIPILLVAVLFT